MVEVGETKCEHCSVLAIFILILYEIEWKLQKRNWVKRTFSLAGSGDAIVNKATKLSIKKFVFLFSKLLNTAVGKQEILGGTYVCFVSLQDFLLTKSTYYERLNVRIIDALKLND